MPNMFEMVEKMGRYKFGDKERERSNHAAQRADMAKRETRRVARCPLRHSRFAWSGPPHDPIQCYICLDCNAVASEPEIVDMGYDFLTVPDFIMDKIWDLDLERQAQGNPVMFGGLGGKG